VVVAVGLAQQEEHTLAQVVGMVVVEMVAVVLALQVILAMVATQIQVLVLLALMDQVVVEVVADGVAALQAVVAV
jgi:hypothetical protein